MLTTHCHLAPRLRTCRALPLLHLHVFMCWAGTPLPLRLGLRLSNKKVLIFRIYKFKWISISWIMLIYKLELIQQQEGHLFHLGSKHNQF